MCVCWGLFSQSINTWQESGLKVNHPASFAVHLNGAQGKMSAKVHSPSGALEECVITELEQGLSRSVHPIFDAVIPLMVSFCCSSR